MKQSAGLAKAAATMAIVAALSTLLAVNVNPPAMNKPRNASGSKVQGIPVPAATPLGGVGVAQERGTAVERREALGGRAPVNSSGTKP